MKLAIVTPVGPGHEETYNKLCRPSIERGVDKSIGRFSEVICVPIWDLKAELGRSRARNQGIARARELGCDWIFFLDADDLLHIDALQVVGPYIDHYDAIWGQICETSVQNFGTATLRQGQITPLKSFKQLLQHDPFLTIQMGHFVKTSVFASKGFDENINAGEDFEYYYYVWKNHHCIKTEDIFFLNVRGNHSSGARSATAEDWMVAAMTYRSRAIAEMQEEELAFFDASQPKVQAPHDLSFLVVVPHDYAKSAGGTALHELSQDLKNLHYEVRILYIGQDDKCRHAFSLDRNAWCFLPSSSIIQVIPPRQNLIVVHGENLDGDFFREYNVVRYYLNKIGATKTPAKPRDGEFVVTWSEAFCEKYDFVLRKTLYKGLGYYEDRERIPADLRTLDLTFIGKAEWHRSDLQCRDDTLMLTREWPSDQNQYLYLLSKTRFLYTYDRLSSVLGEAIVMGAIPRILESGDERYDSHVITEYTDKGLYVEGTRDLSSEEFGTYETSREAWMSELFDQGQYLHHLKDLLEGLSGRFT